MDNLALKGKAFTLATILALCQNQGLSGEEYMTLAPGATIGSDKSGVGLHKNTIKLKIPTKEAMELNHRQLVEINPASSNGVLNFNLPDSPNSFMPPPPGGNPDLANSQTPPQMQRKESRFEAVVPAEPEQPGEPSYRKTTSATIIIPAVQSVPTASTPESTPEPEVLVEPPAPVPVNLNYSLRPAKSLRSAADSSAPVDSGLMPGLITPEQLATGTSQDVTPFALGEADLSDLVSFDSSPQPLSLVPEMQSAIPYAFVSDASEPYSVPELPVLPDSYIAQTYSVESYDPISVPVITPIYVPEPVSEPYVEPSLTYAFSSETPVMEKVVEPEKIMAMAPPVASGISISGSASTSTLDPVLLQFDPAVSRSTVPPVAGATTQGGKSFHSRAPSFSKTDPLSAPVTSTTGSGSNRFALSSPLQPPAPVEQNTIPSSSTLSSTSSQSSDTDGGGGPLRLAIGPLVNVSTPQDTPPVGTVAAGQTSLPPSSIPARRVVKSSPVVMREVDTPALSTASPSALTPNDFGSFNSSARSDISGYSGSFQQQDVPRRGTFGAASPKAAGKASSSARQTRRQARERERDEFKGKRTEGLTNMRDVRSVIGPPDPAMFR